MGSNNDVNIKQLKSKPLNLKATKESKPSFFQSMFSFSNQSSPYDELVEKATAETLTAENWSLMMNISDAVQAEGSKGSKNVLLALKKRLNHRDPHVVLYALALLDCLWNNAGSELKKSVSSRDFVPELADKANSSIRAVAVKVREIVMRWGENDCPKDAALSLIASLSKEIKSDDFIMDKPVIKSAPVSNDPNVVSSAQEEEDIVKAIAASLKDAEQKSQMKQHVKTTSNAYPSLETQVLAQSSKNKKFREVRALYDFEEVEENELPFKVGDIIMVMEDNDPNWWKGQSHRGVGLFPSSFVTDKLEATPAPTQEPQQKKLQSLPVNIDQQILLKCIQMLDDCDPTGEVPDSPELGLYEEQANKQGPLIDRKLAAIDKQMNMLHDLDVAVRNVLGAYDEAVFQFRNQPPPPMQFPDYNAGVFPTMPGGSMMLLQQYQYAQAQGQGINNFPGMNQPYNVPPYAQHQPNNMNGFQPQQQNPPHMPHFTQQVPHQNGHGQMFDSNVTAPIQPMQSGVHGHAPQTQTLQHQKQPPTVQPQVSAVAPQIPLVQPQQLLQQQHQFSQPQTPVQQVPQAPVHHQNQNQQAPVNYQVPPFQPQTFIQPLPQQPQIPSQQHNQGQSQQIPPVPTQPQNVVPPHSATPTVSPLTPVHQIVQPHVSVSHQSVPPTPQNSQVSVNATSEVAPTNIVPVEPVMVAPIQQQQQSNVPPAPQEPTHNSITPQRSTISVQPYEPRSEVVEEQIISLDDPLEEPEPSVAPVNPIMESVPVICPVPIVPHVSQSQENQQFIVPVQPQTQEPAET